MSSTMDNYIDTYYQQIKDGSVIVGEWIKALYTMIEKGLENGSFFYEPKKAHAAIKFIESFCRHHEGALAPNLIKLELWQKAFLSVLFGVVDKDGNRQFRECFMVLGRKNGKTLLAAAIACYMIYLDGEYGARAYFTAPKLDQASFCFDAFFQMIQKEEELNKLAKKRRTDIYFGSTNSSAKPIAFNAKKADGMNIHLCIADEIASWQGDGGLKFYEVLKSSFGSRRQPLLLSITTAGYVNDGVFDELMKRATRVLKGDSREARFLPILYIIDDINKWNDINELNKSNPNLGVSITKDYLLEEIAIAEGSLSKKAEFITKYCNIKQNSSMAWLSTQTVNKCCNGHMELSDFRDSYAFCGLDLSQTTDLTSACVVIKKNGIFHVFSKFWLPAEKIEEATERDGIPYQAYIQRGFLELSGDNFIDYHDCYRWFTQLIEEYQVYCLEIGYDRYSAQYLIQDLDTYGFHTDDVYQGDNLWPIIQEVEGLMKDGRILIGDNDLLKIHFLDSAVKMSVERGRGKLVKLSPNAHIDGMAALLDAFTVHSKYHGQYGDQWENN